MWGEINIISQKGLFTFRLTLSFPLFLYTLGFVHLGAYQQNLLPFFHFHWSQVRPKTPSFERILYRQYDLDVSPRVSYYGDYNLAMWSFCDTINTAVSKNAGRNNFTWSPWTDWIIVVIKTHLWYKKLYKAAASKLPVKGPRLQLLSKGNMPCVVPSVSSVLQAKMI